MLSGTLWRVTRPRNFRFGSGADILDQFTVGPVLGLKQMGWMAPAPGIKVPKCGFHQGPRAKGAIRYEDYHYRR